MSRATVVIESVENYYDIIRAVQERFNLPMKTPTTNGVLFEDSANQGEMMITGRIDDDEGTTTIVIECGDKQTAQDIENWVTQNFT
ncbi:MAG: hypothetical protein Q8930_20950 [Bacillota bacterium]|nr:hypothetical protein [Bacillota bacterium]